MVEVFAFYEKLKDVCKFCCESAAIWGKAERIQQTVLGKRLFSRFIGMEVTLFEMLVGRSKGMAVTLFEMLVGRSKLKRDGVVVPIFFFFKCDNCAFLFSCLGRVQM